MRCLLLVLCLLLHSLQSRAVADPPVPSANPDSLHREGLIYAQQLLTVFHQIEGSYVQPVQREKLVLAALVGLHDAARVPVPPSLRTQVERAKTDTALLELLVETRRGLGNHEALAGAEGTLASCRALLKSLDPHSAVLTQKDRQDLPWGDQPIGVGLELEENLGVGPLRIRKVHPGGSGQKAGLQPGDEITHINGNSVKGMTSTDAFRFLQREQTLLPDRVGPRGEPANPEPLGDDPGKPVRLTVARAGTLDRPVLLEYQTTRPESVLGVIRDENNAWDYLLDRKQRIAHIRLTSLNRGTSEELAQVLGWLKSDGVRGLILDLRWCPGGYLDEAVNVAGLFLDDCVIATIRDREDKQRPYHNTQERRFTRWPTIVLVNGETSGAAELIAAALRDHGRAQVAGQRTRGKASVQTALYIGIPNVSLKLTSGVFVRPSGKKLHRMPEDGPREVWGIRPDAKLEFRVSPASTRQLKQWWDQQTLRPGTCNAILPLDDPLADPQRQLALQGVRELLNRPAGAESRAPNASPARAQ